MLMGISTVSFDKARIYKDKMFFTIHGKDSICTTVLEHYGNNLFNRRSYKAIKSIENDCIVISRRNEYELKNGIVFEYINRIYDKTGKFLETKRKLIKQ